jgi:hypothetical protein
MDDRFASALTAASYSSRFIALPSAAGERCRSAGGMSHSYKTVHTALRMIRILTTQLDIRRYWPAEDSTTQMGGLLVAAVGLVADRAPCNPAIKLERLHAWSRSSNSSNLGNTNMKPIRSIVGATGTVHYEQRGFHMREVLMVIALACASAACVAADSYGLETASAWNARGARTAEVRNGPKGPAAILVTADTRSEAGTATATSRAQCLAACGAAAQRCFATATPQGKPECREELAACKAECPR